MPQKIRKYSFSCTKRPTRSGIQKQSTGKNDFYQTFVFLMTVILIMMTVMMVIQWWWWC